MERNKFDFRIANALVQAVNTAANTLDVQNGQMEKRFGALKNYFNDDGYEEFNVDMTAANREVQNVVEQLNQVAGKIADYSQKLQDEV